MLDPGLTYVAVLTPQGIGAIASCLVLGPGALQAVNDCFTPRRQRPLSMADHGQILYGEWQGGEDLLVCALVVERIEVHCHGGTAAVAAVVESLVGAGCQECDARELQEFTEADPLVRLASRLLPDASTARTAGILLDQYRGSLSMPLQQILQDLQRGEITQAQQGLERLLAFADLGRHLVKPWKVCLAGAPNAGKSSLLNALVGFQRAIVHDQAGTTRDRLSVITAVDGWPLELVDTAGLQESSDPLEQEGIERARSSMESADMVLLVHDASQPFDDRVDQREQTLVVLNKWDLVDGDAVRGPDLDQPPGSHTPAEGVRVSATHRWGLGRLMEQLSRRLVPFPPGDKEPVPCGEELVDAINQAASALAAADVDRATMVLGKWCLPC